MELKALNKFSFTRTQNLDGTWTINSNPTKPKAGAFSMNRAKAVGRLAMKKPWHTAGLLGGGALAAYGAGHLLFGGNNNN